MVARVMYLQMYLYRYGINRFYLDKTTMTKYWRLVELFSCQNEVRAKTTTPATLLGGKEKKAVKLHFNHSRQKWSQSSIKLQVYWSIKATLVVLLPRESARHTLLWVVQRQSWNGSARLPSAANQSEQSRRNFRPLCFRPNRFEQVALEQVTHKITFHRVCCV
jgi:hypothetical protein